MRQLNTLELGKIEQEIAINSKKVNQLVRLGAAIISIAILAMIFYAFRYEHHSEIVTAEIEASVAERKELKSIILHQNVTIEEQRAAIEEQNILLTLKDSIIAEQSEWIIDFQFEKEEYEKAIDSLSIINRFLQRSDLYKRYGTKPNG